MRTKELTIKNKKVKLSFEECYRIYDELKDFLGIDNYIDAYATERIDPDSISASEILYER